MNRNKCTYHAVVIDDSCYSCGRILYVYSNLSDALSANGGELYCDREYYDSDCVYATSVISGIKNILSFCHSLGYNYKISDLRHLRSGFSL